MHELACQFSLLAEPGQLDEVEEAVESLVIDLEWSVRSAVYAGEYPSRERDEVPDVFVAVDGERESSGRQRNNEGRGECVVGDAKYTLYRLSRSGSGARPV